MKNMWSNNDDNKIAALVEDFVYRETGRGEEPAANADLAFAPKPPDPVVQAPIGVPEAEVQTRERRGYERGLQEGEARAQALYAQSLVQSQALAASMAAEFERERGGFFRRVEGEVVRLALAIARKILHREAQMDPLLLAGVARVALEQIVEGTVVRLRVHPQQIKSWQQFFSAQSGLNLKIEWMGDPLLDPSQCRVETTVGSTSLSLEDQLGEIEQGFFDLLAEKPGVA
jgi:flagellar assembly protein FliH